MTAMSDYLENALINITLRGQSWTPISTVYAALYTTATDDASAGTEVVGGSYQRTAVTFAAPSNGVTSNSSTVTFNPASASWGTVTHFALYDASSGGNRLYHGALQVSKTVDNGDIFTFPAGQLQLTLQ